MLSVPLSPRDLVFSFSPSLLEDAAIIVLCQELKIPQISQGPKERPPLGSEGSTGGC